MLRKTDEPDIEVGAAVKAKKLRFKSVPDTDVRLSDGSRPKSERKNLPDKVEPGVTYRDIEVRWHAEVRTTQGRDEK